MELLLVSSLSLIFVCFALSAAVLFHGQNKKTNQIFALFLICAGTWTFGDCFFLTPAIHYFTPLFWLKITGTALGLTIITYFHFTTAFTQAPIKKKIFIAHNLLSFCIYIPNALLTNFMYKNATYTASTQTLIIENGILYNVAMIHCFILTLYGTVVAIHRLKHSTGLVQEQMRYFLASMSALAIGMGLYVGITALNIAIPRIDNMVFALGFFIIAYAITKKRLMDISIDLL